MEDDPEPDPEQWSDDTRERLSVAAQRLKETIDLHVETVATMSGRTSEHRAELESRDHVRATASAFEWALLEYSGTTIGFPVDEDDEDEDESEPDAAHFADGAIRFSLLQRTDFAIDDETALMAAGRDAWMLAQPEEESIDAQAQVANWAIAVYTIGHESGWDQVEEAAGISPIMRESWIVETSHGCSWSEPERDPFTVVLEDGEIRFGTTDEWFH